MTRIAICAPGARLRRAHADAVLRIAQEYPGLELHFHEQCFSEDGHFAGPDAARRAALLDCANDPSFDAVWFGKGGYGSNRIARDALAGMSEAARKKTFLGYSDTGTLLGALYRHGIGKPVHGPMAVDVKRRGGEAAVRRALDWLTGKEVGLEPSLDDRPAVAFNLTTLAMLVGTDFMPDLAGHVVMVEEVAEHLYAIDRLFFHITAHLRGIAGLRLGRVSAVPDNDRPFGSSAEDIARDWCARTDITYLGRADIGHDAENRIVPFGLAPAATRA